MPRFLLTLLMGLAIVLPCQAGLLNHPCSRCGCCQLKKVCHMVSDTKKVTITKYTVEEEEVCLLGKSHREERIVPDECSPGCQRCETVQVPRCGRIVCQKKLKKTLMTVDKPIFKCVIETVCCQCGGLCEATR